MSPELDRIDGFVFFFYSDEEDRMHVHVRCGRGKAKFWLEPKVELFSNKRLAQKDLRKIERIIKEKQSEFITQWREYFAHRLRRRK